MKRRTAWLTTAMITCSLIVLVLHMLTLALFFPAHASAATEAEIRNATVTWYDRATLKIKVGATEYTAKDENPWDTTFNFKLSAGCNGDDVTIKDASDHGFFMPFSPSGDFANTTASLHMRANDGAGSGCVDFGKVDRPVLTPEKSLLMFYYASDDSIVRVDGNSSWQFSRDGTSNYFLRVNEQGKGCQDKIVIQGNVNQMRLYELDGDGSGYPDNPEAKRGSCNILSVNLSRDLASNAGLTSFDKTAAGNSILPLGTITDLQNSGGGAGGAAGGGGTNEPPTCETTGNTPLSWILCPVINGMLSFVEFIFSTIIQPYLTDTGISIEPDSSFYKAWSSFRTIGNILLVMVLLIIVFGQAIGGGMIDAYTAKKALPRLLVAAILVNLSIYVINLLNDITLIIGAGLGSLITAPFIAAGGYHIQIKGLLSNVIGFGALGYLMYKVAGPIGSFFKDPNSAFANGGGGKGFIWLVVIVIVPVALIAIAVLGTIVIRNGIVMLSALIAPVAIVMMVLPGTEKYFRKWLDLFVKALMVYPIIIALFAIANVLSVTILQANEGSLVGNIMGIVVLFAPMVMIPFAFKFAGGAVAAVYGAVNNYGNKAKGKVMGDERNHKSLRNRVRSDMQQRTRQRRQALYTSMNQAASGKGRRGAPSRFLAKTLARSAGGYDIEQDMSEWRETKGRQMDTKINNGLDGNIRGFTVNKKAAEASTPAITQRERRDNAGNVIRDAQGNVQYEWNPDELADPTRKWRQAENGMKEYKTAGGAWVSEADVDEGHRIYGGDQAAEQKAYAYEIHKAMLQQDHDSIFTSIPQLQQDWGLNGDQMNSVLIGAGFQEQNKSKQYKRVSIGKEKDAQGNEFDVVSLNAKGLVDEFHTNMGTYQGIGQDRDTWTTLSESYLVGIQEGVKGNTVAQESVGKMEQIAEQFKTMNPQQLQQYVQQQMAAAGGDVTPGASAEVAAGIQEFMKTVETAQMQADGQLATRAQRFNGLGTDSTHGRQKVNFRA